MTEIRVALLADTHGYLDARIAAVVRGCDIAAHGGDIGSADVLAQLQPRQGRVYAVLGNNDLASKWPAGQQELLADIPWEAHVALPGGDLVLVHGHRLTAVRRHPRLRARYPHARAVCYGHSHRLVEDRDEQPWLLNPGAAGRARTYGGPSCMVLIASEIHWEIEQHRFEPLSGSRRRGVQAPERKQAAGATSAAARARS